MRIVRIAKAVDSHDGCDLEGAMFTNERQKPKDRRLIRLVDFELDDCSSGYFSVKGVLLYLFDSRKAGWISCGPTNHNLDILSRI